MVSYVVNDNLPRNQYVSTPAQTIFTYTFVIEKEADIVVYKTPVGSLPNDIADILILNIDYTVTDVGNSNGGTIVLTVGAANGDILTIQRDAPIERISDFNPGGFTAEEINSELDRQTTFIQDNEMRISELSIRYPNSAVVDKSRDVELPILGAEEFWQMNASGTGIIKAKLEPNADVNTLRSELADNQPGSDGSRIVGYESTQAGSVTVHDQLVKVDTNENNIATNTSNIATNTTNISTNTTNIATNTSNISTNTTNIATNTSAISELQSTTEHANIIIGGNFSTNPFQRRTTATISGDGFIADRFLFKQGGAVTGNTCQRVSDLIPFGTASFHSPSALRTTVVNNIASLAAGDYYGLQYVVEGYDFTEIFEQDAVLQFFVKSSVTGIHSIGFQNGAGDRYLVKEYTISSANTWEKVTIQIETIDNVGVWDVTNGAGLRIFFNIASGSSFNTSTLDAWTAGSGVRASTNQVNGLASVSNNFAINLVTLNAGTSGPTIYPGRFVNKEVALCQRYYDQSYTFGVQAGTLTPIGRHGGRTYKAVSGTSTSFYLYIKLRNYMRTTPTINLYRSETVGTNGDWTYSVNTAVPVTVSEQNNSGFFVNSAATISEGTIYFGHWTASSEIL